MLTQELNWHFFSYQSTFHIVVCSWTWTGQPFGPQAKTLLNYCCPFIVAQQNTDWAVNASLHWQIKTNNKTVEKLTFLPVSLFFHHTQSKLTSEKCWNYHHSLHIENIQYTSQGQCAADSAKICTNKLYWSGYLFGEITIEINVLLQMFYKTVILLEWCNIDIWRW